MFCETVWFADEVTNNIPITEAAVVVPVPLLLVRLRTVLDVKLPIAVYTLIPITCEEAPVDVN